MGLLIRREEGMLRRVLNSKKVPSPPTHYPELRVHSSFPGQQRSGLILVSVVVDSGSESDVPLKKRRKLDDTSRASTPRISTPKGITVTIMSGWGEANLCSAKA